MANLRTIVGYTVPVITALFGLLWYFGKRKPPPDKQDKPGSVNRSDTTERRTAEELQNEPTIKPREERNVQLENQLQNVSSARSVGATPEKVKTSEVKVSSVSRSRGASPQVETERVEEMLTAERSSFVASKAKVKGSVDEQNLKSQIELNSKPELNDKIILSSDTTKQNSSDRKSKINDFKKRSESEENFRDSLNLDDEGYDFQSCSNGVNNDTGTNIIESASEEFNEAFVLSGSVSELNSRTMEKLNNHECSQSEASRDSVISENIERTNVSNTSMSASVEDRPILESSLLESSSLGQPLLESTKLDNTSSLKDLESQIISEQNNSVSVSNISEINTKSDHSSDSKNSWADLSKGCEDQISSVKDSNLNLNVHEDGLSSVADTGSNSSKNGSRHHSKDHSPEPHHHNKSENDTDNGVHSSESNCDSASVDSGKGASIHDILPGISNQEVQNAQLSGGNDTYRCNFPTSMCGRLIGKMGKNINLIKDRTGANISLSTNPFTADFQLCTIEGTKKQIDEALYQISHKFPDVDLSPITLILPGNDPTSALQGAGHPILMPEIMQVIPEDMQLNLPEGVSVDVVVSSVVDAGHIFVQQHTHPSFPSLERLNQFMMACYSTDGVVPQLPRPIEVDVICAAPLMDGWYRAQISCVYEDTDECDVKFVDYGVFSRVPASCLKQIRSDFMTLPFQATECYMANVTPLQDEEYFSGDASATLEMLTQGKLLQAQVVGRTENGIPYVHVYQIAGENVTFVNRELVNRGLTRWIEILS